MSLEDRLYPWLAVYERLPEPLKGAAGAVYRGLPVRWRMGPRFREFVRQAGPCERWPLETVREYQWKHLRQTLIHAANFCPYYQAAFARVGFRPEMMRGFEDLQECPLLEKETLQERLPELVSSNVPERDRLYMTTGGSTGLPVGFYLHNGVSRPKEQAFLEAQWRRAGWESSMRVAVIRGHVTTDRAEGEIAHRDHTRNWLLMSSSHLTDARLPEYLEAIERFRPEVLHAYPSALLHIAAWLERQGQSWRHPLRCVLAGSERLALPQKRWLEGVFGCRVYRWYGHAERVVLAGEGQTSPLFYFWPTYGWVEFGQPDADGYCEIIGTSFHNLAMPLIRYRTGDLARLADPRHDGDLEFPWPAMAEIAGREQEYLVSATNRCVSLTAFNMHDGVFDGLRAVQFFQQEPGVVEFRYVPSPAFHNSRLEKIEAALRRKLGDDFAVQLRAVQETEKTPRGKHRWLVSWLPSRES